MGKRDDGTWEYDDSPRSGGALAGPPAAPEPTPRKPFPNAASPPPFPGKPPSPPPGKGKFVYGTGKATPGKIEIEYGKAAQPSGMINIGRESGRRRSTLPLSILDRIRRRFGSRGKARGDAPPEFVNIDSGPEEMLPAFVYIDSDDAVLVMRFYQAVEQLLDELGTRHTIAKVERGSVFASIKAFFRRPTTKTVIAEKLTVAVDALEQYGMAHVSMSMAQVDNLIAHTLLTISQSAGDNDYAVCLHGVISYRVTLPDGTKRQTSRRITPREAAILDKRPGLLDNPQGLLQVIDGIIELEDGTGLPELTEGPGGQSGGSERG